MSISGRMAWRKVPAYLASQFSGAFLAGLLIYALFAPSIAAYEARRGIVRGSAASVATAKMFGEFYPDPGGAARVSLPLAMGAVVAARFFVRVVEPALRAAPDACGCKNGVCE